MRIAGLLFNLGKKLRSLASAETLAMLINHEMAELLALDSR